VVFFVGCGIFCWLWAAILSGIARKATSGGIHPGAKALGAQQFGCAKTHILFLLKKYVKTASGERTFWP